MNYSKKKLKKEYLKIKANEKVGFAAFCAWYDNEELRFSTPPPRDDIVLCSRNMALLYVSAGLYVYFKKKFICEFNRYLVVVKGYAGNVFINPASVYVFLQIALCDVSPYVKDYLNKFMPNFITDQKSSEIQAFVDYVIKISNRLLETDYSWYGKALIESSIEALRSERFFLSPNKDEYVDILTGELQKYKE